MAGGDWTEDDLARARLPALEALRKSRETNGYWLSVLDRAQENPDKLALARDYGTDLEAVTKADIVAAARRYLNAQRAVKLTVGP
jgi:zinc protease